MTSQSFKVQIVQGVYYANNVIVNQDKRGNQFLGDCCVYDLLIDGEIYQAHFYEYGTPEYCDLVVPSPVALAQAAVIRQLLADNFNAVLLPLTIKLASALLLLGYGKGKVTPCGAYSWKLHCEDGNSRVVGQINMATGDFVYKISDKKNKKAVGEANKP